MKRIWLYGTVITIAVGVIAYAWYRRNRIPDNKMNRTYKIV